MTTPILTLDQMRDMDVAALTAFISGALSSQHSDRQERNDLRTQELEVGRRSAERAWLIGHALLIIREHYKEDAAWMKWIKENKFMSKKSTLYNYMDIAKRVEDEEAIKDKTLTQIRVEYGLVADPGKPDRRIKVAMGGLKSAVDKASDKELATLGDELEDLLAEIKKRLGIKADGKPRRQSRKAEAAMA